MHEITERAAAIFRTFHHDDEEFFVYVIFVVAEKRIQNFGIMNIIGVDVFLWYSKGIGCVALVLNRCTFGATVEKTLRC